MSNAFTTLQERGFFYQLTDEDVIRDRLTNHQITFYVGFDPTADSLHLGHLLPVMAARFLQSFGHRAIMLVGGGTAMIGDPSGKTESRQMLSREDIQANAEALKAQIGRYIDFSAPEKAIMVDNADWLMGLHYVDFLRDVGKNFSVNRMMSMESVKMRLEGESGLSFLEFNYMLLQAYDFYVLNRDQKCEFQFGGQDQWGNIVMGIDLTRRMLSNTVYGATFPLLTNANGEKFGKSAGNAVWLDAKRTSIFDFYQFWRNVDDSEVAKLLLLFTTLPAAECKLIGNPETSPNINRAKEILAYEATTLAHGSEAAKQAYVAATTQFGFADPQGKVQTTSAITTITKADLADNLPTHTVSAAELAEGLWIVALVADAQLAKSRGEARRHLQSGAIYVNDEKITDLDHKLTAADFSDNALILRHGKKNIRRIVIA